jgi:hypothetical protein
LIDFVCRATFSLVDSISVDSKPSESRAVVSLRRSIRVLSRAKGVLQDFFGFEVQLLQIEFLLNFTDSRVFARFGIPYAFKNFQDSASILPIANLCRRTDFLLSLASVAPLFSLNLSTLQFATAGDCFRLGLLSEGLHFLSQIAPFSLSDVLAFERFVNILSFPCAVDVCALTPENTSARVRLPRDFATVLKSDNAALRREIICESLSLLEALPDRIFFASTLAHFDAAFAFWAQLGPAKQTAANAFQLIIIPAIAPERWNALWKFVREREIPGFPAVLTAIFKHCSLHHLTQTFVRIHFALQMYEDAIRAILQFARSDETWFDKLNDMKLLVEALQLEKERRQKGENAVVITSENLDSLTTLSGLQVRFVQLAIDNKMPFNARLDLVLYTNCVEEIAAIALFHKKFNFGLEVAQLNIGAMEAITDRLLDTLTGQRLGEYFAAMKLRMGHHSYAYLCTEMLKAVKHRAADLRAVPKFVTGVVPDRGLQAVILARLEYLDEAIAIAEKDKNKQALGEILEVAERKQNTKIAGRCKKLLGK